MLTPSESPYPIIVTVRPCRGTEHTCLSDGLAMFLGAFEIKEPVPALKRPRVLACLKPWFDAGAVGTLCLDRTENFLKAKPLGELARPGRFYDFTRYRPAYYEHQNRLEFLIPNASFYYSIREEEEDIIFLHVREPNLRGEELIESILEVLKYFEVSEYTVIGGMYDLVPHTRPLLLSHWDDQVDGEDAVPSISALYRAEERPASLLELVGRYAANSGVATKTVAVHLPGYLEMPKNWIGVVRLQEFICEEYGLPASWPEHRRAEELYQNSESYLEKIRKVPELIGQLEEVYDNWQRSTQAPCLPLYPAVEQFLRELA